MLGGALLDLHNGGKNFSMCSLVVPQILNLFFTFTDTMWILKQIDTLSWQELGDKIFKEGRDNTLLSCIPFRLASSQNSLHFLGKPLTNTQKS